MEHDLISELKSIASEIGRSPTKREYLKQSRYGYKWESVFGLWSKFTEAAGLESKAKNKKPVIELDIESDLEQVQNKNREPIKLKILAGTVVVGDLHFPFVNKIKLKKLYEFIEKNKSKIKRVIQIGDLTDLYAWSKFPRSHNYYSAKDEMALAKKMAVEFWDKVRSINQKAELIQILGNHDSRSIKRTMEVLPEAEHIINEYMEKFFTFEGVTTIHDTRQELIIDDCIFIHGYRTKLGDHTNYNRMSTVVGHSHRGGVVYKQIRNELLFEANAGYLGDPTSKALSYTPQKTVEWTHGFLFIDEYGPRFIAL